MSKYNRKKIHPDTLDRFRWACINKNLHEIKHMVLHRGLDVNSRLYDKDKESDQHTPLTLVVKGYVGMIHMYIDWCLPFLIHNGADPNLHPQGCSALDNVLMDPMNYPRDAVPLLINAGANIPLHALEKLLPWDVPDLIPLIPHTITHSIDMIKEALLCDHHDIFIVDWAHRHGLCFHDRINESVTWLEWMCESISYTKLTVWGWVYHPREPSSIHCVYRNECDTFYRE